MIRTLALIAFSGFVLAVVCLSVAIGMAGPDFIERGAWRWSEHGWDYRWDRHNSVSFNLGHGEDASRTLPWNAETMEIDVPGDVHFTQGSGAATFTVHGPKDALDHLVVDGGRIRFDRTMLDAPELTIELTAPKVTAFTINGSGRLDVDGYRQDSLTLKINGDGNVEARGAAKSVDLAIAGAGDADLSDLSVDGAAVRISGSGDAKVGPKSWSRIDISGSGDVTLTSRPTSQETHVSGSGHVEQEGGASTEGAAGSEDGERT